METSHLFLQFYNMSIIRDNGEKLSSFESSEALFAVMTSPLELLDLIKQFLATNPTAQRVIQTVSRI